jgi:hypothetical protein
VDFLFGSSDDPFSKNTGFDTIALTVVTPNGKVNFTRVLETRKINVNSTDKRIASGEYNARGGNNSIGEVWMQLIGIEKEHLVIKNVRFEKQRLTWRSFAHMFLIKESDIIKKESVVFPGRGFNETAVLSALYFFLTGNDFADASPQEEKKLKEARKKAVRDYIHKTLSYYSELQVELSESPINDAINLQEKVELILDEINATEKTIFDSIARNKSLLKEIFAANEQLTECNTLFNRYQALRTQYASDIKRLTFIVDGELQLSDVPANKICPFCENEIPEREQQNYVEAAQAELDRIRLQTEDLAEAETDIIAERLALEKKVVALNKEKSNLEMFINNELKPKSAELKQTLDEYRKAIELKNTTLVVSDLAKNMQNDLYEEAVDDEDVHEFKIKNHFDREVMTQFSDFLSKILVSCRYEGFKSAHIDPAQFDVVVNGKSKRTFGKGYRAFLNTVFAITLMELLLEHGTYAPGILIVDSPILTLYEKVDDEAPETMKAALFQYLLDNQNDGQTIVIENKIPDRDYSNANIIRFTKDETQGRYGLLDGVR